MAEAAIILKVIVILISIFAWISFKSEKSDATKKLSELGDTVAPRRDLRPNEFEAFKDKYNIDPDNKDVYELIGEINVSSISTNNQVTEKYFTIGGYKVTIPDSAVASIQPGDNLAEVVLFNKEAWLISLNQAWYVQTDQQEIQTLEENKEQIASAKVGKLQGSELEVIGERQATPSEVQQVHPYSKGIGSMLTVLLIAGAFYIAFTPLDPIIASVIALILLPFSYWLFRNITRKHNSDVKITRMRGAINWVEDINDSTIKVHFDAPKLDMITQFPTLGSNFGYLAPASWKEKLPVETVSRFEIANEQQMMVSIGHDLSLTKDQPKPKAQIARHISMLIGVSLFLALIVGIADMTLLKTSVYHVFAGRGYEIASASELKQTPLLLGDKLTLSGQRDCLPEETQPYTAYCQQFYYQDQASMTVSSGQGPAEILSFFDQYDARVFYPIVSEATYSRLRLLMLYSGEQLDDRRNIREYTTEHFQAIAKLTDDVCRFSEQCAPFKQQVIQLWQSMLEDRDPAEHCTQEVCWQQMLSNDLASDTWLDNQRNLYQYDNKLSAFLDDLRITWLTQEFSQGTPSSELLIKLTSSTYADQELGSALQALNEHLDSETVADVKASLMNAKQFNQLTGIVTKISQDSGQTTIELNTDITRADLLKQLLLVIILIILTGLILLHLGRILVLKNREEKPNS